MACTAWVVSIRVAGLAGLVCIISIIVAGCGVLVCVVSIAVAGIVWGL